MCLSADSGLFQKRGENSIMVLKTNLNSSKIKALSGLDLVLTLVPYD